MPGVEVVGQRRAGRLPAEQPAGQRERGVGDGTAALAAEAGIAVFRVSFERWVTALPADPPAGDAVPQFVDVVRECLSELRAVTA